MTGKTVEKVKLLSVFKKFLDDNYPSFLNIGQIGKIKHLADNFRNPTHEKIFNYESCKSAREIVFNILDHVTDSKLI